MLPSTGDPPGGLEASEILRYYRGHGDSSSHHAGGDGSVRSVHAVQHPEEVDDCGRIPQARQQQEVSWCQVRRLIVVDLLCLETLQEMF